MPLRKTHRGESPRPALDRGFHRALTGWIAAAVVASCSGGDPNSKEAGGGSASGRDGGPRTNVLFISSDTLRSDHVAAWGYERPTSPAIDRLVKQGVQFERAFAPRSQTWPSLTSVMTSKYPVTHGVRTNGLMLPERHESLAELLQGVGFDTAAFISNMSRGAHRGYDNGVYSNESEGGPQEERDRELARLAIDWMRERTASVHPFFLWVHFMNPHGPYSPPDEIRSRFHEGSGGRFTGSRTDMERIALEKIELTEEEYRFMLAGYDGDVVCADDCIGRVLDAVESLGLADETLVVFFSDHGEELYQRHRYFMHSTSVYDSVLHVPLIVRLPGRVPSGSVVPDVVELIDIAPTTLDVLGIEKPSWMQGSSLVPVMQGRERSRGFAVSEWHPPASPTDKTREWLAGKSPGEVKRALAERGIDREEMVKGELTEDGLGMRFEEGREPIYVLRTDDFRFVMNHGEETPNDGVFNWVPGSGFPIEREELYDHRVDPGESRNRVFDRPTEADALRQKLSEWVALMERAADIGALPDDPETLRKLQALGYLGGPIPGTDTDDGEGEGSRPNPVEPSDSDRGEGSRSESLPRRSDESGGRH